MGRFIMDIKGLANTTLTDYPGLVAATLFTGGCDFCCPFCHNRSLVVHHEKLPSLPVEDVLEFLSRRKVALEGVVLPEDEPLLQNDLGDFIRELKAMGYKIKLDTNGYDPTHLDHLLKDGLVDYVAMDIKGAQSNYAKASGCPNLDLTRIKLSVDILKGSDVDYEFRTTVVRELHSAQDMEAIGQWLYGRKSLLSPAICRKRRYYYACFFQLQQGGDGSVSKNASAVHSLCRTARIRTDLRK